MHPGTDPSSYLFTGSPSLRSAVRGVEATATASSSSTKGISVAAQGRATWTVPAGYPWLDVEIGGGMAAAYNHRVHMDPDDMPAMHLCDVGDGVNLLGYYMVRIFAPYHLLEKE